MVAPTWAVYPNPTTGAVFVTSQEVRGGLVTVSVQDMAGRLVYLSNQMATPGGFTHKVESATMPKGIYTVSLVADGLRQTKRLVVQ
jgi:hypothetical protein